MLRRLVEAHYAQNKRKATAKQVLFWLTQCRTPEILIEVAARDGKTARRLVPERPLLGCALERDDRALVAALDAEEQHERELDREYWLPLRRELEQIWYGKTTGRKKR